MSQWDSGMQGNPQTNTQGPPQVTFYDPTAFQKGATPSNFQPPASLAQQNHNTDSTNTAGFQSNDPGANPETSNSWNSWGAWDSNSAAYNTLGQAGTNDQPVVSDSNAYNQQWYGQNQWDQSQHTWDPNTQQWVPNQFNYQQGDPNYQQGDPNYQQGDVNYQQGEGNQIGGYNPYWTGEGGVNGQNNVNYNDAFQAGDSANHSGPQANFYQQNYNTEGAQLGDNVPHQSGIGGPVEASAVDDTDEYTEENTDELDESTEPTTETESSDCQSLNRSLGNYEEGNLDGYGQTEEFVHENEGQAGSNVVQHAGTTGFVENYSNNGSAVSVQEHKDYDLSGQMQAVSLQDNVPTDNIHVPSHNSIEQTVYSNHPGQFPEQQQQHGPAPFMVGQTPDVNSPPQIEGGVTGERTEPVSCFSDWEMVHPPQTQDVTPAPQAPLVPSSTGQALEAPSHSRNASIDDNVHFFIGSNASSTRVSPAQKVPDEPSLTGPGGQRSDVPSSAGQTGLSTVLQDQRQREEMGPAVSEEMVTPTMALSNFAPPQSTIAQPPTSQSHPPPQAPPAMSGPPPMSGPPQMSGPPSLGIVSNKGGNPFRKSPMSDSNLENTSILSSTRLDVTKPDYENSPVILNQSISPIQSENDNPDANRVNPQAIASKSDSHVADTPRSTGSKKTGIPESPIMHRKESPFQPPGKNKPIKASHDIQVQNNPENKQENVPSNGNPDRKGPGRTENPGDRRNRSDDRRTPDWDTRRREGEGRKTPDWDRRREGRRTPDWDRRRSERGYGRRTPDLEPRDTREDKHSGDPDQDRYRRYRDGDNGDRVMSRPPRPGNGNDRDRGQSSRPRQSAFHQIPNRGKNSVSPATSLWETPDNLSSVSNILLVPQGSSSDTSVSQSGSAQSMLTPVTSLITSLSENIKSEETTGSNKGQNVSDGQGQSGRDRKDRTKERDTDRDTNRGKDRDTDDRDVRGQRSYENLRDRDRSFKDSRANSREKLSMYSSRNSLDQDDPRDRSRRGDSREREKSYRERDYYSDKYRDRERDRDRPPSRNGSTVDGYSRRDYRDRDSYRDREYNNRKYDRDRPRSRQGDRPMSRQGEGERPRSRGGEYDRDSSYYKDKYNKSGYDYDEYYRRGGGQYYDKQYYDYYYGHYGHGQGQGGYYDEHGYYHSDQRYPYDYYQRRSRAGTPGSLSDGGQEISKIEEKSKKSDKNSDKNSDKKRFDYPPELHDYSHRGQHYGDYYGYYDYDGYRWDPDISQWVATTATEVEPQRQTPEKFMYPHVRAAFGPGGQLVKVLANGPADGQPATIEIHDTQTMLEDNIESEELKAFPGPLVRGDTHKNDVLLFCQQRADSCIENMDLEDRESAELIWRFLELLIKQNGTVVGTDIADLLLKGHEPTTSEYKRTGMKIAASTDNLELDEEGSEGRVSRGPTPIDRSMVNRGKSTDELTDRFRHLLLYGRKKDAIDWAMKNNLWGHALFLASKMDSRMHANVMTRFANVAMRMNDPLQTLYQLMSGRQPASVTSVGEERWGDWRPHLAMILSNHSNKPELDRKSITQLGDTLASRGFLHASHFCYLMSQTSFGSYHKKSSKIVLIGSSHSLPLDLFAHNEAIQCTEIYEYALALGHTAVSLANFQYFKYLYCCRLIDYGLAQEALQYCEVISKNININPAYYQHVLVKLVYDMSCQLKSSDPHIQESGDDEMPDPDWLRALHTTLVQFEEGAIQSVSGTATPAYMGTAASSESGEVGMILQGNNDNGTAYQQDAYMNGTVNKQDNTQHYQNNTAVDQSQYMSQYSQEQYQYQQGATDMSQYAGHTDMSQYAGQVPTTQAHTEILFSFQSQYGQEQYQYQQGVTDTSQYAGHTDMSQYAAQVPTTQAHTDNTGYQQPTETTNYANDGLQWPEQNVQPTENHMTSHMGYESTNQNQDVGGTNQNMFNPHEQTNTGHYQQYGVGHHHPQPNFPSDINLGESQTSTKTADTHRSSLASTSSYSQHEDEQNEGQDTIDSGGFSGQGIFDLQPAQTKIVSPRLRQRTLSESSNGSAGGASKPNRSQFDKDGDKKDNKSLSKPNKQGNAGGGIWGKIGGLFSRNKNEMKLPDDKEPSIVWDPVKEKWVDKDADEVDTAPPPPPPKDVDISGGHAPIPGGHAPAPVPSFTAPAPVMPSSVPNSMPPPASGANKYSRKKGLGARGSYVDVMNPKPVSNQQVPTSLFSTLPSVHSAPAIFNPSGGTETSSLPGTQSSEPIPEENHSHTGNQIPSSHSQGGLSLPPSSENNEPTGPMQTSLPTMFNPAQFQGNQSAKIPTSGGPGHRLSNRRVYPK